MRCPTCSNETTLVHCGSSARGPLEIDACLGCGSIWFDRTELESLRDAADGVSGRDLRDAMRELGPRRVVRSEVSYFACPKCEGLLHARPHPSVAGISARICALHGAWVERRDLLALLDEIERVGVAGLERHRRNAELWERDREDGRRNERRMKDAVEAARTDRSSIRWWILDWFL